MLYPTRSMLTERSSGTRESLQDAVEQMKRERLTGCIKVHLREGEYTIAFEEGNLIALLGPMASTLDILLDRIIYGEMSAFTIEKKLFSSYIGYLERRTVNMHNTPLNVLLVDLVNKRHTGVVEVVNDRGEGVIFLVGGIPETAFYQEDSKISSGTEALEGITKMAEESDPRITVFSAEKSMESFVGSIPVSEMKVRGLFFSSLKSHVAEKLGDDVAAGFAKRLGRSHFDLVMYPLEEFKRATEIANAMLGCTDFELGKIVYQDFRKSALGRIVFLMENVDTPSGLARVAQMAWTSATNYGERWVEEDTDGRIVMRVKNDGDRCERVRGVLAGAMESIGYESTVRETECEKRGGRFCEFVVEWDAKKYRTKK